MKDTVPGVVERKVIYLVGKLPDEHLYKLSKTQEQVRFWLASRYFQNLVSCCWHARFTGEDDPLKPLLSSGELNQDIYDRVWLVVDFYEQLWGLVQLVTPYVQSELSETKWKFLAESAYKLFARLIWNEVNSDFAVCLKPYHEFSARKYEKAYRLAAKRVKEGLNLLEEKKLHGLLNQERSDLLLQVVIAVAYQRATKSRLALKSKLEMFHLSISKLYEKEATISRKIGSFAWRNGRLSKGSRYGGTYFTLNKTSYQ